MGQRQTIPVLPLRGTVIFPGLTAPIAAGRPGTLRAIESALKGDRLVFAVAQRDNTDEPTPDILYSMGVIARIGQIQRGLGGVQLLLQGEQRATAPLSQARHSPVLMLFTDSPSHATAQPSNSCQSASGSRTVGRYFLGTCSRPGGLR